MNFFGEASCALSEPGHRDELFPFGIATVICGCNRDLTVLIMTDSKQSETGLFSTEISEISFKKKRYILLATL